MLEIIPYFGKSDDLLDHILKSFIGAYYLGGFDLSGAKTIKRFLAIVNKYAKHKPLSGLLNADDWTDIDHVDYLEYTISQMHDAYGARGGEIVEFENSNREKDNTIARLTSEVNMLKKTISDMSTDSKNKDLMTRINECNGYMQMLINYKTLFGSICSDRWDPVDLITNIRDEIIPL